MARRLVILTGTAQLNILVGNVNAYEQTIADALRFTGFDIVSVRITKQTIFTNQINISIECNVDSIYSAEQARLNANAVLSAISGQSYAYYDSSLLSNVNLRVLSDALDRTASTTGTDTTGSDAISNIINAIGKTAKDATLGGVDNLTSNFATPLMIGAVIIVGMFLLKPPAALRRYSRY